MNLGALVEQAVFNQIAGLAILALIVGIVIGAIVTILVRRRSGR